MSVCTSGSTTDPGQKEFSFNVGINQVVRGWDEGFMQMREGEKARLEMTGECVWAKGEGGGSRGGDRG